MQFMNDMRHLKIKYFNTLDDIKYFNIKVMQNINLE